MARASKFNIMNNISNLKDNNILNAENELTA